MEFKIGNPESFVKNVRKSKGWLENVSSSESGIATRHFISDVEDSSSLDISESHFRC